MSQKLTCPFCGAVVKVADDFCHHCGSELDFLKERMLAGQDEEHAEAEPVKAAQAAPQTAVDTPVKPVKVAAKGTKIALAKTCSECATQNPAAAKFCLNCGHSFIAKSASKSASKSVAKLPVKKSSASARTEITVSVVVSVAVLIALGIFGWQGMNSSAGFKLSGAAGTGTEASPVLPNGAPNGTQNGKANGRIPNGAPDLEGSHETGTPPNPQSGTPQNQNAPPQNGMPQNPSAGSAAPTPSPNPPPLITADKAALERIDAIRSKFDAETAPAKKADLAELLVSEYAGIDRFDLAGQYAEQSVTLSGSKDVKKWLRVANLYDDGQAYSKAIAAYEKVLELDSKLTDARVDLAICLLNAGEMRRAVQQMKQAVTDNPSHQKANLNMGILNAQIGQTDEAKKYWQAALALNPNSDAGKKAKDLLGESQ